MKLLLSLASLILILVVSCGGTPATGQAEWDAYRGQIDSWRVQIDEKLAIADAALAEGPSENDNGEWLTSLQDLGVEIDSITFVATTVHPPHELEDYHQSFILATDFYKLVGRLLSEFTETSGEARTAFRVNIAGEIAFAESNLVAAQVLFDKEADKR